MTIFTFYIKEIYFFGGYHGIQLSGRNRILGGEVIEGWFGNEYSYPGSIIIIIF